MGRVGGLIGGRERLMGVGGFALTAVLALFHGRLLWQRLTDGSLLQPVVVARWLVSALLVFALLQLWSKGLPVLRGRRAGVLWLVVVLLHAFTPAAPLPAVEPVVEGMLPVALALLGFVAFGLVATLDSSASAPRRFTYRRSRKPRRASAGWHRALFSRPPPFSLRP